MSQSRPSRSRDKSDSESSGCTPPRKVRRRRSTTPDLGSVPGFDPSKEGSYVKEWIQHIEDVASACEWSERRKLYRATQALEGEGRAWYNLWLPEKRSWKRFQKDLLISYPREANIFSTMEEIVNFKSTQAKSLVLYAGRMSTKIKRLGVKLTERQQMDIMLGGIVDKNISIVLEGCETMQEMVTQMSRRSMSESRFNQSQSNNSLLRSKSWNNKNKFRSSSSRRFNESTSTCFKCGKPGHKRFECKSRPSNASEANITKSDKAGTSNSNNVNKGSV